MIENITVIYLQPGRKHKVLDIKDDLHTYYKLLNCDTIDIVKRSFGGITCDVVCDDEGLLKENPLPCSLWIEQDEDGKFKCLETLVGNLVLAWHNDVGDLVTHPRFDELEAYFDFVDYARYRGVNVSPYVHGAPGQYLY